jgi:hypothetical protein
MSRMDRPYQYRAQASKAPVPAVTRAEIGTGVISVPQSGVASFEKRSGLFWFEARIVGRYTNQPTRSTPNHFRVMIWRIRDVLEFCEPFRPRCDRVRDDSD